MQQRFGLCVVGDGLERRLEADGLFEQLLVERADGVGERGFDVAGQLRRGGALGGDGVAQRGFVFGSGIENAVLDHVNKRRGLDADDLAVLLDMNFVAGENFFLAVNALARQQLNVLGQDVGRQRLGGVVQVGKAALFSLLDPGLFIAVAVEDDAAVGRERVADQLVERGGEVRRVLELRVEFVELFGHDGVEDRDRARDGLRGAGHAELKLIAGEGDGRGSVAVGRILRDGGEHVHADAQGLVLGRGVVVFVDDGIDDALKLGAEEDGDDSRGRFLRAETVIVAREGNGAAQKLLILIHALDERGEHQQEHGVLARRLAGGEEVFASVGRERPVNVLARAVDAREGLFVQQAHKVVALGDLFHRLHDELVLVARGVGVGVDGGHLVLAGGDLVVLGLGEHAELPQLFIELFHVGGHAGTERAEVVVVQLLTFRGLGTEQGAAAQAQIHAL